MTGHDAVNMHCLAFYWPRDNEVRFVPEADVVLSKELWPGIEKYLLCLLLSIGIDIRPVDSPRVVFLIHRFIAKLFIKPGRSCCE